MIPNFSWLIENKIAGVSYPRSEEDFATLKALGVRAFLTLAERPLPADMLMKFDFQVKHLPVADFTAPTVSQVEQAIAAINSFLDNGLPVAVHCGAGLGRTGTVLACYLVWQGTPTPLAMSASLRHTLPTTPAEAAIASVRAQRPGSIETPEQVAVVGLYESHLARREQ